MHKPSCEIEINAGKGGVGKSTVSAAKALFSVLKEHKKTLVVDMDGGKALARVIELTEYPINSITRTHIDNLDFTSIQTPIYLQSRRELDSFETYMKQFPDDYGLIAFNDMLHDFFGVTTDVEGLHKFITLVQVLQQAKNEYDSVIIDVEPTTGLGKLINSTNKVAKSIHNLSETGFLKLKAIGAFWPDIKAYLQSDYIKHADHYMERLLDARQMIMDAKFSIVTIPEPEPIEQIKDVIALIDSIQGDLSSIIFNNTGRLSESMESEMMEKAKQMIAHKDHVSIKKIPHNPSMFIPYQRHNVLSEIGESLSQQ